MGNPYLGVWTLELPNSRVTCSCSVKYLLVRVAHESWACLELPVSDITFHNVRNHKAVYAHRCLLICFIVYLSVYSLNILLKYPQAAFHYFFAKKQGHTHYQIHISVKPRGAPREYPLVGGSWLNLTWPMLESTRSKYCNRAVTYSIRAVMVISFLKL